MKSLLLVPLALGLVVACAPKASGPPTVAATEAWCRAAPNGALAGGCYLTLTASADDRLVAVETSAADHGEIHTMSMTDGIMRMRRLDDGLALPARQAVALKPGGEHLMIIGPKQPLNAGGAVPLTLRFAKAAAVTVSAPIRQAPAMSGGTH